MCPGAGPRTSHPVCPPVTTQPWPGSHRGQRRESGWKGSSPEPRGCSEARSEEGQARPEGQRPDSAEAETPAQPPGLPRAQHTAPHDLCPGHQPRACLGAAECPLPPSTWPPSSHPAGLLRCPAARPSSQICGCYSSVLRDGFGGAGPLQCHWGGSEDENGLCELRNIPPL